MVIGSVGLDQYTKMHAHETLRTSDHPTDLTIYTGRRQVLVTFGNEYPQKDEDPTFLSLSLNYVRNQGAAWGALSNMPDHIRIPFFYGVTVVAVIIIGLYLRSTPPGHRLARFALTLILSGAIGNFLDRIRLGYVIDWIDVRWDILTWRYYFPNFNVADSAITVGVGMLLFEMLVLEHLRKRKYGSPAPAPVEPAQAG